MEGESVDFAKHKEGNDVQINDANTVQILAPPIFKLNLDCCDEMFALLSLADLHSISQTCKPLQQVAGAFFQQNYKSCQIWIVYSAFRLDRQLLDSFSSFIENICFDDPTENFRFASQICNSSIKKIYFDVVSITEAKIRLIKRILNNVEVVMLSECIIDEDIYEIFLKFCPNLKRLSVVFYEGFQNQWLFQKYSALEYLKLAGQVTFRFRDVETFFENNPNCTSFWIDARYLMEKRHSLLDSNLKWSDLTVSMATTYADNMRQFLVLFEELYSCGAYDRLHLFLNGKDWDRHFFKQLASLPALVNLCLEYFENFDVEHLHQLNKLEIYMPLNVSNEKIENIAKGLVKLERIVFRETSTNAILPFIRHSKWLKEIRICTLKNGKYFKDGRLNVAKLNQERQNLKGAKKVIIYVEENVFLTTRWATLKIDFNFIEMRRLSSYADSSFYATYI